MSHVQRPGVYSGKVAFVLVHPEDSSTPDEGDIVLPDESSSSESSSDNGNTDNIEGTMNNISGNNTLSSPHSNRNISIKTTTPGAIISNNTTSSNELSDEDASDSVASSIASNSTYTDPKGVYKLNSSNSDDDLDSSTGAAIAIVAAASVISGATLFALAKRYKNDE